MEAAPNLPSVTVLGQTWLNSPIASERRAEAARASLGPPHHACVTPLRLPPPAQPQQQLGCFPWRRRLLQLFGDRLGSCECHGERFGARRM